MPPVCVFHIPAPRALCAMGICMHVLQEGACERVCIHVGVCVCVYVLILSKLLDLPVPQSPDLYLPIGCSEDEL